MMEYFCRMNRAFYTLVIDRTLISGDIASGEKLDTKGPAHSRLRREQKRRKVSYIVTILRFTIM